MALRTQRLAQQFIRDVRFAVLTLAGKSPPPTIAKPSALAKSVTSAKASTSTSPVATSAPTAAAASRYNMVLAQRRGLTAEAAELLFESASALPIAQPGQFITLQIGEHRRAYSVVAQPAPAQIVIAVKRVASGVVSNQLLTLPLGTAVTVGEPAGRFVYRGPPRPFGAGDGAGRVARYLAVAAGSGITPVYAIAKAVLAAEPTSEFTLVFGNRSMAAAMYRAELEALHRATQSKPGRFTVVWVNELAEPEEPQGSSGVETTNGGSQMLGKLDQAGLRAALKLAAQHALYPDPGAAPRPRYDQVWLCGPAAVMANAEQLLTTELAVPSEVILQERFGTLASVAPPVVERAAADAGRQARTQSSLLATIHVGEREYQVVTQPGDTLLQAAQRANVPMASSCTMGGCGACRVSVLQGELVHDEPNCLTAAERSQSYALACVARLHSNCAVRAK